MNVLLNRSQKLLFKWQRSHLIDSSDEDSPDESRKQEDWERIFASYEDQVLNAPDSMTPRPNGPGATGRDLSSRRGITVTLGTIKLSKSFPVVPVNV